ncbi:hypothetical protein B0H11DRAFT_87167 [Mycena galericulata]|nr:hypothetical protein B0H11DRAFT_87167 [Mycena galericulata]
MATAALPPLPEEEQRTIDAMCADALFVACDEDSPIGDIKYHLRQLWETAVRIGFSHGQKEVRVTSREDTDVAKQLEQERVWGFDVGWRLATEKSTLKASKISSPTPSLPSMSTAAVQTDRPVLADPVPCPVHPASTILQTEVLLCDPCEPLDWAEDESAPDVWQDAREPDSVSAVSTPSSPTPILSSSIYFPRDFSELSSGTAHPFASLQRRNRRSPRGYASRSPPARKTRPQTVILKIYDSTQLPKKHTPRYCSRPLEPPTSRPRPTARPLCDDPCLEWDHDPRLRDLGRALTALGWVRPG